MNDPSNRINNDILASSSSIAQLPNNMVSGNAGFSRPSGASNQVKHITATSSSFAAPSNLSTSIVDSKKKKPRQILPTIRFELNIDEPSSEKFTEFNYNKLAVKAFKTLKKKNKIESKKEKKNANPNEPAPLVRRVTKNELDIIDDELVVKKELIDELLLTFRKKIALSKELDEDENRFNDSQTNESYFKQDAYDFDEDDDEEDGQDEKDYDIDEHSNPQAAHGSGLNKKSKKKSNKNLYEYDNNKYKLRDFSHLGKGYDENDSFIDNSDAHDVHVPKNMAPKRGGFYVNKEQIKLEKITKKSSKSKSKTAANAETKKAAKPVEAAPIDGDDDEDEEDEDYEEGDLDSNEESYDSDDSDSYDSDEDDSDENDEDDDSEDDEDKSSNSLDEPRAKRNIDEINLVSSNSNSLIQAETKNRKRIRLIDDEDDDSNKNSDDNKKPNLNNKENKKLLAGEVKVNNPAGATASLDDNKDRLKKKKIAHEDPASELNNPNSIPKLPNSDNDPINKKKKVEQNNELKQSNLNVNNQILNRNNEMDASEIEKDADKIYDFDNQCNSNNLVKSNTINELPISIPATLKDSIVKLVDKFNKENLSTQNVWPDEFKKILLNIYQNSQTLKPIDKAQVNSYLSDKLGKPKENLVKICKRMINKETGTTSTNNTSLNESTDNQVRPQQPQAQQQKQNMNNSLQRQQQSQGQQNQAKVPSSPTHNQLQQKQQLRQSPQSMSQQTPQSLNELNEELRNKLVNFEKLVASYKQKNDMSKIFENNQVNNSIYLIDGAIRNCSQNTGSNLNRSFNNKIKDFCVGYLAKMLEINLDDFSRKYEQIASEYRIRNLDNNLRNKLIDLKKEVDVQMEKCKDIFNKSFENYKNVLMRIQNDVDRQKVQFPKKQFEWTVKIRELFFHSCNIKTNLLKLRVTPSSLQLTRNGELSVEQKEAILNNERDEQFKKFIMENVLNIWPDSWMSLNELLIKYDNFKRNHQNTHQKNMQQRQQQQQQQQQPQPQQNQNQPKTQANQLMKNNRNNSAPPSAQNPQQNQQRNGNTNNSLASSNGAVISLSSKNGKQVVIQNASMATSSSIPNQLNTSNNSNNNKTLQFSPSINQNLNRPTSVPSNMNKVSPTSSNDQLKMQQSQQATKLKQQQQNKVPNTNAMNQAKPVGYQQQQQSPNKPNVYDSVVNRFNRGPSTSSPIVTNPVASNSPRNNNLPQQSQNININKEALNISTNQAAAIASVLSPSSLSKLTPQQQQQFQLLCNSPAFNQNLNLNFLKQTFLANAAPSTNQFHDDPR